MTRGDCDSEVLFGSVNVTVNICEKQRNINISNFGFCKGNTHRAKQNRSFYLLSNGIPGSFSKQKLKGFALSV